MNRTPLITIVSAFTLLFAGLLAFGSTDSVAEQSTPATSSESTLDMKAIPVKKFKMGCDAPNVVDKAKQSIAGSQAKAACFKSARPKHLVKFSHRFAISTTEITQGLWLKVMGGNPAYHQACGLECPVEQVSWFEALDFSNRLSEMEGLEACYTLNPGRVQWKKGYACTGYRLPTEAEWEAAARGDPKRTIDDKGSKRVHLYAWLYKNSDGTTHPVGTKKPDSFGLYDTRGNVAEWTWSRFGPYPKESQKHNPKLPKEGKRRVFRGGSAFDSFDANRRIHRGHWIPAGRDVNLGFRLARTIN